MKPNPMRNCEGLTLAEWLAARWPDSRQARQAWWNGEDPTDYRAATEATK